MTGALDTGVQFANRCVSVRVAAVNAAAVPEEIFHADVAVIDAEVRHKTSQQAYNICLGLVQQALRCGTDTVYIKTDSGLRGNIGAMFQAALDAGGAAVAYYAPALPQMNRLTRGGIQYIDGVPIDKSVFGQDPFEPVHSPYVKDLFRNCRAAIISCGPRALPPPPQHGQQIVICDAEKPVALAGIMGGANSGMDENTTSLLFECATFARDCVRKTSRALGQNSDSSARYEKGVDRNSPELGLARALHLIQELDCGDITTLEYDLTDGRPLERKHIVTTPAKICGVLGITVPEQTMIDILQRLEFTVDVQADGSWDVSAPLYREDVESFPDLAEEVIREYGYDHINPTFLNTASVTNGGLNYAQKQQLKTKRLLAAQGFYEASTLAFYSNAELDMLHIPAEDAARKAIRILNPISENLSIMRTLLTPSMLNVIVDNLKKGNAEGRLFEMAPVYLAKELPISEHPHERQTLCIGAFGPEEDFFTVKGAMEALAAGFDLTFTYERETAPWLHPGISAAVYCNGKRLGVFGKLSNEINGELEIAKDQKDSQNIYLGELDYEALMSCVDGELRYKPLSPYTAVKRDLALVCEEKVTCGEIEDTIKKASSLITEVKLFDIYRGANLGEGKKSMAFSLTLSDPSAEISAEQVERTVKKVLGNLKFKLGIEIR